MGHEKWDRYRVAFVVLYLVNATGTVAAMLLYDAASHGRISWWLWALFVLLAGLQYFAAIGMFLVVAPIGLVNRFILRRP